jgi:hypothetical protein
LFLFQRMAAPPPGTSPTVLPPQTIPSTIPTTGQGVMPPGIDVSGSPIGGLSAQTLAPPPPQLRGPPPSVAMPPPPGMEVCIFVTLYLSVIYYSLNIMIYL